MSVCLSIISVYPSVYLSIVSISLSILSVHLPILLSICMSIYLSIHLSCLSAYRVCLSASPVGSFPLESPEHYTASAALG